MNNGKDITHKDGQDSATSAMTTPSLLHQLVGLLPPLTSCSMVFLAPSLITRVSPYFFRRHKRKKRKNPSPSEFLLLEIVLSVLVFYAIPGIHITLTSPLSIPSIYIFS